MGHQFRSLVLKGKGKQEHQKASSSPLSSSVLSSTSWHAANDAFAKAARSGPRWAAPQDVTFPSNHSPLSTTSQKPGSPKENSEQARREKKEWAKRAFRQQPQTDEELLKEYCEFNVDLWDSNCLDQNTDIEYGNIDVGPPCETDDSPASPAFEDFLLSHSNDKDYDFADDDIENTRGLHLEYNLSGMRTNVPVRKAGGQIGEVRPTGDTLTKEYVEWLDQVNKFEPDTGDEDMIFDTEIGDNDDDNPVPVISFDSHRTVEDFTQVSSPNVLPTFERTSIIRLPPAVHAKCTDTVKETSKLTPGVDFLPGIEHLTNPTVRCLATEYDSVPSHQLQAVKTKSKQPMRGECERVSDRLDVRSATSQDQVKLLAEIVETLWIKGPYTVDYERDYTLQVESEAPSNRRQRNCKPKSRCVRAETENSEESDIDSPKVLKSINFLVESSEQEFDPFFLGSEQLTLNIITLKGEMGEILHLFADRYTQYFLRNPSSFLVHKRKELAHANDLSQPSGLDNKTIGEVGEGCRKMYAMIRVSERLEEEKIGLNAFALHELNDYRRCIQRWIARMREEETDNNGAAYVGELLHMTNKFWTVAFSSMKRIEDVHLTGIDEGPESFVAMSHLVWCDWIEGMRLALVDRLSPTRAMFQQFLVIGLRWWDARLLRAIRVLQRCRD